MIVVIKTFKIVASKLGFVIKKGTSKVIITVGYWDEFNFYIICRN